MYAVIFRSTRNTNYEEMYQEHAEKMERLVKEINGYLGHHSHRDPNTREGLTISYFDSLDSIRTWREHPEHLKTQELGRKYFYESYDVKVVRVEREYEWHFER
jgi:heme-degrading monooxygenase HmoA